MEVTSFSVRECYVYAPLPAPDAAGYRAQAWDVDNWAKEVGLKIITTGDDLTIKLFDRETSELFAECPIDNNKPVQTSVEAVLDSSRYHVLRIADRVSGRHAFIGIGFRERHESTDFMAAISDHRQYLARKQQAEKVREEYTSQPENHKDYSLKPGEKIKLQLPRRNSGRSGQTKVQEKTELSEDDWGDFVSTV